MENQDKIKDFFADKLGNYQAPVNPQLWNAISSQIASATVVTTSISVAAKIVIGISAAGIIGIGTYFFMDKENVSKADNKVAVIHENPKVEKSINNSELKLNDSSINNFERAEKKELIEKPSHNNDKLNQNTSVPYPGDKKSEPSNNLVLEDLNKGVLQERKDDNNTVIYSPKPTEEKEQKDKINIVTTPTTDNPDSDKKKATVEITNAPNVYSTNHNGEFSVEYTGKFLDYSFVVLDMNNKIVFETNNPDFKWYGEMKNGEVIPTGRYFYLISGRDEQGNKVSKYQQLIINP